MWDAEICIYSCQIGPVAVRGELHATVQAARNVRHELIGGASVTPAANLDAMSFVSPSMQVHVQAEPRPASRFSSERFVSLPPTGPQLAKFWTI